MFQFIFGTVPSPPSNLKIVSSTSSSVTLQWVSTGVNPADATLSYLIEYREENKTKTTRTVNGTQVTLNSLSKGKTYTIRVAIKDSEKGSSAYSSAIQITVGESK